MSERPSIERIREDLLIATDQEAEALRLYLEEEERKLKADQLLDQRLREKAVTADFVI